MTTDRDRSVLLLLTGLFAVWLVWSGIVLDFVRPSMRPFVLLAGVVAVLLALLPPGGLLARRTVAHDHVAHEHGGLAISWLLVVPLLAVILVPPSPLGANAVRSRLSARDTGPGTFPPLGRSDRGAVPMSMAEFATRALRDESRSLDGVRVRLVGFVSGPAAEGYRLGRFVIFCCAADAEAVEVVVTGDGTPRSTDEWLEVEGVWVPGPAPALRADSAERVGTPKKPYEYTDVWSG